METGSIPRPQLQKSKRPTKSFRNFCPLAQLSITAVLQLFEVDDCIHENPTYTGNQPCQKNIEAIDHSYISTHDVSKLVNVETTVEYYLDFP